MVEDRFGHEENGVESFTGVVEESTFLVLDLKRRTTVNYPGNLQVYLSCPVVNPRGGLDYHEGL